MLVARLLLAAVFAASAAGKAVDGVGTRQALIGFGVPAWAVRPGRVLLPIVELTTAGLLLVPPTTVAGAAAALALLAVFSVAIATNLGRGRTPDCHCFGQLHSAPISGQLIWRNVALAAPALLVLLAS